VLPATGGSSPLVVVFAVALLGLGTVATRFVRRA
jgi:LPXTG-motif cell wall-anchored protein